MTVRKRREQRRTSERPYPPDYVSAETLAYRLDCQVEAIEALMRKGALAAAAHDRRSAALGLCERARLRGIAERAAASGSRQTGGRVPRMIRSLRRWKDRPREEQSGRSNTTHGSPQGCALRDAGACPCRAGEGAGVFLFSEESRAEQGEGPRVKLAGRPYEDAGTPADGMVGELPAPGWRERRRQSGGHLRGADRGIQEEPGVGISRTKRATNGRGTSRVSRRNGEACAWRRSSRGMCWRSATASPPHRRRPTSCCARSPR